MLQHIERSSTHRPHGRINTLHQDGAPYDCIIKLADALTADDYDELGMQHWDVMGSVYQLAASLTDASDDSADIQQYEDCLESPGDGPSA